MGWYGRVVVATSYSHTRRRKVNKTIHLCVCIYVSCSKFLESVWLTWLLCSFVMDFVNRISVFQFPKEVMFNPLLYYVIRIWCSFLTGRTRTHFFFQYSNTSARWFSGAKVFVIVRLFNPKMIQWLWSFEHHIRIWHAYHIFHIRINLCYQSTYICLFLNIYVWKSLKISITLALLTH